MSIMTWPGYKMLVKSILLEQYGIDMEHLDTSPLRGWYLNGWSAEESAKTLAIKDGFPE